MNILLILCDELRWDCLGCAGHPLVKTPNIDRLAARGVRFVNAYCTAPLCVPARAQMLTGMPCWETNVWGLSDRLPPSFFTYPRALSEAGWFTAAVGKMHFRNMAGVGSIREPYGFQQLVLSEECPASDWREEDDYWRYLNAHGYGYLGRDAHGKRGDRYELGYIAQVSELPHEHFDTTWTGRETIRMIEAHADKPFAITCSFVKPHFPAELPRDWPCPYRPEDVALSPAYSREHDADEFDYMTRVSEGYKSIGWLDESNLRRFIAHYYGNIALIDDQVGLILDKLDELALTDRTLVVFTSDHGESLGERGLLGKFTFYEESARVPMVVAGPMVEGNGRTTEQFVLLEDLCPTFLDLAGLAVPPHVIGRSLLPLLRDETAKGRNEVFGVMGGAAHFESENAHAFLRTGSWKYLYQFADGRERLYDLQTDPHERNDLSKGLALASRCTAMNRRLASLLRDNSAGCLTFAGRLRAFNAH